MEIERGTQRKVMNGKRGTMKRKSVNLLPDVSGSILYLSCHVDHLFIHCHIHQHHHEDCTVLFTDGERGFLHEKQKTKTRHFSPFFLKIHVNHVRYSLNQ
jgi:hypothetical protein